MGNETVDLIDPDDSWREAFIDYCEEFKAAGEPGCTTVVAGRLLPIA